MLLKGSKTEKNLQQAFAGESMARNKYTYYASQARKDGYARISQVFLETADNEKEHAKIWFKYLNGIGNTEENLAMAEEGENYEWMEMYQKFAEDADEEGFAGIAKLFREIAKIEKEHALHYAKLRQELKNGEFFNKKEEVYWVCMNCGYVVKGKDAPSECPVCEHSRSYFKIKE